MDDIDTRISELMILGWSTWKIAQELHRTQTTIRSRRKKLAAMPGAFYPPVIPYGAWSSETDKRLREFWEQGLTSGQIADILEVSRSAVMGRVRRMNLPLRKLGSPSAALRPRKHRAKLPPKQRVIYLPAAPVDLPLGPPVHIVDLENHHCRYPGERGPDGLVMYCGLPKEKYIREDGKMLYTGPWCPYHAERCIHPDYRSRMLSPAVGKPYLAVDNEKREGAGL